MAATVRHWLLKSEPDTHILKGVDVSYPWSRLLKEKRGPFFGVRNFQARNNMRDKIKLNDLVFFYHSSCKEPGVYGIARVVREAYPDPDAEDTSSPFYDAAHTQAQPRWFRIDLEPASSVHLPRPVLLPELRASAALNASNMILLRQPRLSVQPVTDEQWDAILAMANGPAATSAGSGSSAGSSSSAAPKSKRKPKAQEPATASGSSAASGDPSVHEGAGSSGAAAVPALKTGKARKRAGAGAEDASGAAASSTGAEARPSKRSKPA